MFEIIDELGAVNKAIKELEATASKLKAQLLANGVGTYEGAQFYAVVTEYDQARIVPDLVRKLSNEEFVSLVTVVDHKMSVTVKPLAV